MKTQLKQFISKAATVLFYSFLFMSLSIVAFAQDSSGTGGGTGDVNYLQYFASPVGMVALILLATGWITTKWPDVNGEILGVIHVKQLLAFGVALALCTLGFYMQLGLFVTLTLAESLRNGMLYGTIAAGLSTIPAVQFLMQLVAARKSPKK